jgi:hypothetical protein
MNNQIEDSLAEYTYNLKTGFTDPQSSDLFVDVYLSCNNTNGHLFRGMYVPSFKKSLLLTENQALMLGLMLNYSECEVGVAKFQKNNRTIHFRNIDSKIESLVPMIDAKRKKLYSSLGYCSSIQIMTDIEITQENKGKVKQIFEDYCRKSNFISIDKEKNQSELFL